MWEIEVWGWRCWGTEVSGEGRGAGVESLHVEVKVVSAGGTALELQNFVA